MSDNETSIYDIPVSALPTPPPPSSTTNGTSTPLKSSNGVKKPKKAKNEEVVQEDQEDDEEEEDEDGDEEEEEEEEEDEEEGEDEEEDGEEEEGEEDGEEQQQPAKSAVVKKKPTKPSTEIKTDSTKPKTTAPAGTGTSSNSQTTKKSDGAPTPLPEFKLDDEIKSAWIRLSADRMNVLQAVIHKDSVDELIPIQNLGYTISQTNKMLAQYKSAKKLVYKYKKDVTDKKKSQKTMVCLGYSDLIDFIEKIEKDASNRRGALEFLEVLKTREYLHAYEIPKDARRFEVLKEPAENTPTASLIPKKKERSEPVTPAPTAAAAASPRSTDRKKRKAATCGRRELTAARELFQATPTSTAATR